MAKIRTGEVSRKFAKCLACEEHKPVKAKGLCDRCYIRTYKRRLAARARALPVPPHAVTLLDEKVG